MRNFYLCDTCEKPVNNPIESEICYYRLQNIGKIVVSDDDERQMNEICEHYKEIKR